MTPISLAILNPIAFIFIEIGSIETSESEQLLLNDTEGHIENVQKHWVKTVVIVTKGILTNPIIVMTILGIFGNFIFKHKLPIYLADTLQVK